MERFKQQGRHWYVARIDLKKAYDSVRHVESLGAIQQENVDVRVVRGFLSSHLGSKLKIKFEEFEFLLSLLRGIRQGLPDPTCVFILFAGDGSIGCINLWDHEGKGLRIVDHLDEDSKELLVHHLFFSDHGTYYGKTE